MVDNQNIEAMKVLSSVMQTMIDNKLNNVARDRTRIGMVKTVNSDGTFNLLIDGKEYNNIQSYGDNDIVVNEVVKVVYPDNNPTNMFILAKPSRQLVTTTSDGWMLATDKVIVNDLNTVIGYILCGASVDASDKGTYTGHILVDNVVEIVFQNGNNVTSPTITINSVTYTLSGIPNIAPVVNGTNQTYRFRKSSSTVLTYSIYPDYVCERNTSGGFYYQRYASGYSQASGSISVAMTNTTTFLTGIYIHNGTFSFTSGIFNATPSVVANLGIASADTIGVYGYGISATTGGVQYTRGSTTGQSVAFNIVATGVWK